MVKFKYEEINLKYLQGKKVAIYFNLNRRCYSLKMKEGSFRDKVVAYVDLNHPFLLKDVTFKVRSAGRDRVRLEKTKNVHAFIEGTFSQVSWKDEPNLVKSAREITYNPYIYDSFVIVDSLESIFHSEYCIFTEGKIKILEGDLQWSSY